MSAPRSERAQERALIDCCVAIARGQITAPTTAREANACRVASMILGPRHRTECARLARASTAYFDAHPAEQCPDVDVVRRGWVTSLPRFHEALDAALCQ